MSLTHTIGYSWSDGSTGFSASKANSADGASQFSGVIPHSSTNNEVDVAFPTASLKSIVMTTDVALTLHTNTTGGAQTFTLAAGNPFVWVAGSGITNPFTVDVTKFFFDNADGAKDANLEIRILKDVTP